MRYRADIDGLRAIAVLAVIFFHLGVPWVTGGYVGVDVFFVISGFLITRIIYREAVTGTFSIINFYERRARRILPALVVVVLFSVIAAHLLLPPFEYDDFGLSVVATLFSASNFHFKDAIDYFAPAAEYHPLLHSWSLAVEEQFYLLFPLFMLLLLRFGQVVSGIVLLMVLSFAVSVASVTNNLISPETAFYLLPARAWELLIGAVLALELVPVPKGRLVREGMAFLGFALIMIAIFVLTSKTPFPGFAALLPCLGAVLIILAGEGGESWTKRGLSLRPVVFVGLISYSLYLWHWPVLAFLRHYRFSIALEPLDMALAALLFFLAATASWWFVERPFRNRQWLSQKQVFRISGGFVAALSLVGLAVHLSKGVPERVSPDLRQIAAGAKDLEHNSRSCALSRTVNAFCRLGPADMPADTLLWGDSHAGALMSAVEVAQTAHGKAVRLAFAASCPPLLGVRLVTLSSQGGGRWRACQKFNKMIITWLEKKAHHEIKTVVLVARWALSSTGKRFLNEAGPPTALARLDGPIPGSLEEAANSAPTLFARGLEETLSRLRAAGLNVIMLGSIPEIGWNVPRTLVASAWQGRKPPPTQTFKEVTVRHSVADTIMKRLGEKYGVKFVPIAPFLCKPDCKTILNGHPLYVDDDHISAYAARNIIGPWLVPYFKEQVNDPSHP